MQLHGGKVLAESDGLGLGSTFTVVLPIQNGGSSMEFLSQPGSIKRKRVLLVEDAPDIALLLKSKIKRMGHEVELVATAEQALKLLEGSPFDVIVSDIGLPGGWSGYDLATHIRSDRRLGNLLLVALTGYATKEDQLRAYAAGFDYHLAKPVEPEVLQEVLQRNPLKRATKPVKE